MISTLTLFFDVLSFCQSACVILDLVEATAASRLPVPPTAPATVSALTASATVISVSPHSSLLPPHPSHSVSLQLVLHVVSLCLGRCAFSDRVLLWYVCAVEQGSPVMTARLSQRVPRTVASTAPAISDRVCVTSDTLARTVPLLWTAPRGVQGEVSVTVAR